MSTAIVYYSLNGNSEFTAKKIAEKTGADLIKLVPVKAYPKTYWKQLIWGGKSVVMKEKPKLEPYTFDAEKYDTIIIGTPVWAKHIRSSYQHFPCRKRRKAEREENSCVYLFHSQRRRKNIQEAPGYIRNRLTFCNIGTC